MVVNLKESDKKKINYIFDMKLLSVHTLLILLIVSLSSFQADKKPEEYYKSGMDNVARKDYLKAIGDFTSAISLKPDYADAYLQRALTKHLFGEKMGFFTPDLCLDLIEAARHGKPQQAIDKLDKLSSIECHSIQTAMLDPENVFCVDVNSKVLPTVPTELKQLKFLAALNLWNNKLTTVGPEIESHPYLVNLNVGSNRITTVSASVGKLKWLRILNLSKNSIRSLPNEIGNLQYLEILDMRYNALSSLPSTIGQLKSLKSLDLTANSLAEIPAGLASLTQLENLILTGNPLKKADVDNLKKSLPKTNVVFIE